MWWAKLKLSFPGSKTRPAKFTQFFFTDPSNCVTRTTRLLALSFVRGKFCHGTVLALDGSMVRVPANKAGERVQAQVHNGIFPFQFCNRISIYTLYY